MPRIHTTNARRRAREKRALGYDVLQSWSCYVDDINAGKVYLVMKDTTTDRGGGKEYGSFPRRLFPRIDVKRGLLLTVEVVRGRGIVIRPVPLDPNARNEGAVLADLLRRLRFEHDARESAGDDDKGRDDLAQVATCRLCGRAIDMPDDPLSRDCGGDCWGCIGSMEADEGYQPSVDQVDLERQSGLRPTTS